MKSSVILNSLLVPVDFSPPSLEALDWAKRCVQGEDPTILLMHVLNVSLVNTLVEHGFGTHEEVIARLRNDADRKLNQLQLSDDVKMSSMVCEGVPFVEIVQKANDFDVDAVVMSKVGQRQQFETLLFGSTAEKVARGCRQPVIVLPSREA